MWNAHVPATRLCSSTPLPPTSNPQTELRTLPEKSEFLESVVADWERLHMAETELPVQLRPKVSKDPQPGQEERRRSYVDAANEAHVQNVNYNGLVSHLLKTNDPMQLTAV